jgi:hypothetical protein
MRSDEHIYNAEEVISGPPAGSIPFTPFGSVLLPATSAGDVTVFTERVPLGYDGVILGQMQGYSAPLLPSPYVSGSGDIVWRVAVDGRYVRDCGNMIVELGSIRTMSSVVGGLQLRSGNVISYIVYVPNITGALTPGIGDIVCGLFGYFYPRK